MRCCSVAEADHTVSMLRPWDRPLMGLPMAGAESALATEQPLMLAAEQHAGRIVWQQSKRLCQCALGTESGRRLHGSPDCCLTLASHSTAASLSRGPRLLWAAR